jgi:hypothetical protein
MKPIPKLDDQEAMTALGRRSSLARARNDACEALRDAATAAQSMPIGTADERLIDAERAIARLREIAVLWEKWKL